MINLWDYLKKKEFWYKNKWINKKLLGGKINE